MRRRGFVTTSLLTLLGVPARAASPPVVLELFTSQGCSSCPPADALLGELTRRPGVIGLAWHVDYWNNLGWRDPFARRAWTDRQRAYARSLNAEVYTPALVVNGAAMVVGSDRAEVAKAIERSAPPPVPVTLRRAGGGLEAEIGESGARLTGLLAIYDPEIVTQVGAGENHGRRLIEYRVVRDAIILDMSQPQRAFPSIADTRGAVLLLQDPSSRILGAAELPPLRPA